MTEAFPDDIHSTAVRVVNDHYDRFSDRSLYDIVGEALLAQDKAATERTLALLSDPPIDALQAMWEAMFTEPWDGTQAPMIGAGFDAAVAAIRSQP